MPDFLSIPGNIRQQYMPFTIEGPGQRQLFSFKPKRLEKKPCPTAIIHPFSKHFSTLFDNDSSFQYTHGPDGQSKVKYDEFLDLIPAIQIREYMPDAKLTQTFKWFSYFKKGFDAGLKDIDTKSFNLENIKATMEEVMKKIGETMKKLTSGNAPLLRQVVGGLSYMYQDMGFNIGDDNGFAVLFLPFLLYYRLTTTHTNNIYEIPYSMQNEIMKSDGTYGWSGGNESDFGLVDAGIKKVGESPIARLLLGNTIRVNMMPSFQPNGEAHAESFTINIDLINDTAEAAINNFLLCHTLFGNNRWLQYGFVQAGASLYDVKLPGANRYFMCSGQFSCKGKGAFRTPNDDICDVIASSAHATNTFSKYLKSNSDLQEEMIKASTNNKVKAISESGSQATGVFGLSKREYNAYDPRDPLGQFQMRSTSDLWTKAAAVKTTTTTTPTADDIAAYTNAFHNNTTNMNILVGPQAEAYKRTSEALSQAQMKAQPLQDAKSKFDNAINDSYVAQKRLEEAEFRKGEIDASDASAEEKAAAQEAVDKALKNKQEADAATDAAAKEFSDLGGQKELDAANSELAKAQAANEAAEIPIREYAEQQATQQINGYTEGTTVTLNHIKELIKIPDVYSLTLTFNSLLPDNFNNYLFGFRAANLDPIDNYARGSVDERGVFELLVEQLKQAMLKG